jgi:hypothetical protein
MSDWASDWADAVRDFQETFGPYFPALLENAEAASDQLDWLENRVFGNPLDTVRKGSARRDIPRTRAAFTRLGGADAAYCLQMNFALQVASEGGDEGAAPVRELLEILMKLGRWHHQGELSRILDRFEREALSALDALRETGNVRWDAVLAVDALHTIWRRNTQKVAPRTLNPASKFARYLGTGFNFLEIDANPVSAFRTWSDKGRST